MFFIEYISVSHGKLIVFLLLNWIAHTHPTTINSLQYHGHTKERKSAQGLRRKGKRLRIKTEKVFLPLPKFHSLLFFFTFIFCTTTLSITHCRRINNSYPRFSSVPCPSVKLPIPKIHSEVQQNARRLPKPSIHCFKVQLCLAGWQFIKMQAMLFTWELLFSEGRKSLYNVSNATFLRDGITTSKSSEKKRENIWHIQSNCLTSGMSFIPANEKEHFSFHILYALTFKTFS